MSFGDSNGHWETVPITIYQTITVTLPSVAGLAVGTPISISGNTGFNGQNLVVQSIDAVNNKIKIGYGNQAALSGTGGTISISAPFLIRNANVVTANTATAHDLNPGDMFTVSGVANTVLGSSISAASRVNNVTTITTTSANGIRVGCSVIVAGVTDASFNGVWEVSAVLSDTQFQYTSSNLADATSSSGTVSGIWNATQRFVVSVPSPTSLTYEDSGPDAQTTSAGTITPVGQVNGGIRHAVCMFETEDGYITAPSNPTRVTCSGNKKLLLTNIPIGPANVTARVFAFTAVDGGNYFYIPVPARNNGSAISTSTVVTDNTSTSALFDFSDDTLLSATAIDVDGNNLFRLKTLGNCSGVAHYADRMFFWGDENKAINFQNMGFEGGLNPDGTPAAWTVSGAGISVVSVADFGNGVQFAANSFAYLQQTAYLNYYGEQILEPNTQYTFKCWAKSTTGSVVAQLVDSNTLAILATAIIPITGTGFIQGKFDAKTPEVMPAGISLRVSLMDNSDVVTLDEFSCIFTAKPYNDTTFNVSYIQNPESVDAVTGLLGATADPTPIMDSGRLRDNFYFVTQSRLHTTKDQESSEPSGWSVNEVADKCGSCTMQGMISGENWLSWPGQDGVRMFDGGQPIKITQEVQAKWDVIDSSRLTEIQGMNDSENRRMYWRVPLVGATSAVYQMDYRFAETAGEIEDRGAIRISSYTGKMLVIDLSRKFSAWTIPATAIGFLQTLTGNVPCFSDAQGRTYSLDPNKYSDDDYGTIPAYYVTSPFVSGETEQQLQLGSERHFYSFLSMFIYGTGKITVTPLVDSLTTAWPARGPYKMTQTPNKMIDIGLNVSAERCFFKFSATPMEGSQDAAFSLSRMIVTMQPHPYSPVRTSR